jgi:predicted permease
MTLALSIGASTTVFSLLNSIVFRRISVAAPDRLTSIGVTDTRTMQPGFVYVDAFTAFRAQQRSFSKLSLYSGGRLFRVETRHSAVDAMTEGVMPEYFELLGARVMTGRSLNEADNSMSGAAAAVVVISERFWRRVFASDPNAVGDVMKFDGTPATIVGVIDHDFYGLQADAGTDLFLPVGFLRKLAGDSSKLPVRAGNIIARLAPGVTMNQARAEVTAVWPGIQSATVPATLPPAEQDALRSQPVGLEPLATGFSSVRLLYGRSVVTLAGLTGILLAIACANLTGLVFARTLRRRREIAVRVALGAGRARLFQYLLLEVVLLAVLGVVAALPLAWWSTRVLTAMVSVARSVPLMRPFTPDARVISLSILTAIIAGLVIGILPAWRVVNGKVEDLLQLRGGVAGTLGRTARIVLFAQVALSLILAVSAGLFLSTLSHLRSNETPFRSRQIVWTRLSRNPGERGKVLGRPYYEALLRDLSTSRGASTAALSLYFPAFLGNSGVLPKDTFAVTGQSASSTRTTGLTEFISPGFFDVFGIARLRGRDFSWDDDARAPQVAIVNESLARKLVSDGDIVGKRVRVSTGATSTDVLVVGVAADAPIGGIREPHIAVAFRPMMQDLNRAQSPMTHVLVNGDLSAVRDAYVRIVEAHGHHFVRGLFTLDEWIDFSLLPERLVTLVATFSALLTVLLACIGLAGLLAYAVASRQREIGVRMALGATRQAVLRMIVSEGVTIVALGVVVGIPCALAAGRVIRSQLYGVSSTDPAIMAWAAALFVMSGILAALLPAARASRIDPVDALRQD